MTSENHFSHVWKSFFPRLKIVFPTSENHFSLIRGKMIFRRGKNDFQTSIFIIQTFFPQTKWAKTLVNFSKFNFFQNISQNDSKHLEFFFKNGIFQKFLRIFWFIQKIANLKINFFTYKMSQNTCKNFQRWNFSKNAQNLLIHSENWKSFFFIHNGSKHL